MRWIAVAHAECVLTEEGGGKHGACERGAAMLLSTSWEEHRSKVVCRPALDLTTNTSVKTAHATSLADRTRSLPRSSPSPRARHA